ncbi:class I glutamine amidotransferase-like protein [Rhizoctonia solani]|uniref:Class I glutamine amidotransferase-like protein n=1 Tax=Rhizoctonia solani TaxID=456999 RepID=A0A8H7I6F1_9AGAM|nr:class I glutamine amidotransferase-like protein [Rhizoctonia solani]
MELIETAGTKSATGAFMIANPKFPTPEVKFETEYLAERTIQLRQWQVRGFYLKTFSEVGSKQFDIILIPGGDNTRPGEPSKALTEFLEAQVPGARYVLSVCTGSWVLATLGFLDGKRATTNKFLFKEIKSTTSPLIHWVPRARWVVDGKFWTGSGVTAGQDMGLAFLKALQGTEFALAAKNVMEFRAVTSADDDEFADVFHLA